MTTWWDVYETLLHLLLDQNEIINNYNNKESNTGSIKNYDNDNEKKEEKDNYNLDNSEYLFDLDLNRKQINKPNGYSLFLPIPNRNCKTANIPSYLCSCDISVDVDIMNNIIKHGAIFLVSYVNDYMLRDFKDFCMILTLYKIIEAQMYQNKNKYSVIFQTRTNNAIFDAHFTIDNQGNFQIYGKIIRLNQYGNTANCIKNYYLRNFCYCYENNLISSYIYTFFNILKLILPIF